MNTDILEVIEQEMAMLGLYMNYFALSVYIVY